MAVKMNLCFLLIVAGLGLTLGRGIPYNCPGVFDNFVAVKWSTSAITIQDICGTDFNLDDFDPTTSLTGLTDMEASVNMKCPNVDNAVVSAPVDVTSSDVLETLLKMDIPIQLPAMGIKQEYCLMSFMVKGMKETVEEKYESKPTAVIVYPDHGNAEVAIVSDVPETTTPIVVSDGNLHAALQGHNIKVTYSNLKMLDGGAPYFAAAFLRPLGHPLPSQCTQYTEDMDLFPYLELSDILVMVESFDGPTGEIELRDKLPTNLQHVYGKFELVVVADVLSTIFPETNRCDNYKSITFDFQSTSGEMSSTPPMCYMVPNIFDPKNMAFIIRGVEKDTTEMQMPWRNLFETELEEHSMVWKKSLPEMDSSHDLKMRGFALLNLLWNHTAVDYASQCESVTDVEPLLRELDGMDTTTLLDAPDVTQPTFTTAFVQYKDMTDATTLMSTLMNLEQDTTLGSFDKAIKIAVVKSIQKSIQTTATPTMPMDETHKMESSLEEMVKNILRRDHPEMYDEQYRAFVVGNLTSKLAHLKMKYTTNTCFNKVYDTLVPLLMMDWTTLNDESILDTMYINALFDNEKVDNFKELTGLTVLTWRNASRLEVNSCIKRIDGYMRSMCDEQMDITDPMIKKKVCLLNHFRMFVKDNTPALGLTYIMKELLKERKEDEVENQHYDRDMDVYNPLMVRAGGLQLWMEEEGAFNKYTISPTYNKVCKRKMAVCLCPTCDEGMDGVMDDKMGDMEGEKPAGDETLGDGKPSESTTPSSPPSKRRK